MGCFLEVDLDYLDKMHYLHNDYISAPGKIKVTKMLPECQLEIIEDNRFSLGESEKLVLNPGNKKNTNSIINT